MNIIKKFYYKNIFKEINIVNEQILNADKWEDIELNYEARPPYTWEKDINKLNLINEYFVCLNMSYRAEEKVKELHKEWCDRQQNQ